MVNVETVDNSVKPVAPKECLVNKRKLTKAEIAILESQGNYVIDGWDNFYVEKGEGNFDPKIIHDSTFSGFVILGKMASAKVSYNDLHLYCGIYDSRLNDVVLGDFNVIRNVSYLDNYRLGNRVILFNIQEMCCTKHSKFGNGILKKGEPEEHRVWLGIGNENDGRRVLPFEEMIPADAYIWSHYRDDPELLQRFIDLTEHDNTGELNTYGIVGNDCVLKNSSIIKDAKIGDCCYIKGALKLKNITILSSDEERSQVGEGVELVNGILGYGSRVFYQAMAIRFVIGRNCQVKYGARLLNSVLGDNSTVSCCEMLNNLIYPFHEQHHNSSFLIATTVMGQSNIAAGATIGSNHNSRSPDGEIFAKRGFWPGLCSDFKHNSRFASFCLVSKGSYPNELDIVYPFALVIPAKKEKSEITIIPAWWFIYDMFAIARNSTKFKKRDKRKVKVQHIETNPIAPDTMEEVMIALARIIRLSSEYLKENKPDVMEDAKTPEEVLQAAKDYLHQNPDDDFVLYDEQCQKKYGAVIAKPVKAYKTYRKVIKYIATETLMDFCRANHCDTLTIDLINAIRSMPLYTEWENVGGQIIPSEKIQELFTKIKNKEINTWAEVHYFYDLCDAEYNKWKTRYALYCLERLYSRPIEEFSVDLYRNIIDDVTVASYDIYNASLESRRKDYLDYYRTMTYRNQKEMDEVIGPFTENEFLVDLHKRTKVFVTEIKEIFRGLIE